MKKLFTLLLVLVASLAYAEDPRIHRPTGRVAPSPLDSECSYVETPWGVPCAVTPEVCRFHLVPVFVETNNRFVVVKLITDKTITEEETTVNFTNKSQQAFEFNWPSNLKWVEWWVRDPSREYFTLPDMGCYCNDLEGKIYICIRGMVKGVVE